jgi:hypothetical protein
MLIKMAAYGMNRHGNCFPQEEAIGETQEAIGETCPWALNSARVCTIPGAAERAKWSVHGSMTLIVSGYLSTT